jgi:hypothetical protein
MRAFPPLITTALDRLIISPSAIVPSWQLRHRIEFPVGWPGWAMAVELEYGMYVALDALRFHMPLLLPDE